MMTIRLLLGLGTGAAALLACQDTGTSERAVNVADLPYAGATVGGPGWQTAPFPTQDQCANGGSEWIKLDRKKNSAGLVIAHGLGRVPAVILPYVSFEKDGCDSTLGAGDVLVIDHVDEDSIRIHNNTDEYFYLRLVLQ